MLPGGFQPFAYTLPQNAEQWELKKPHLREKLLALLGEWPALFTPSLAIERREEMQHYWLERFLFDNGLNHTVYGYFLIPKACRHPLPAVLYHHYHGRAYSNGKDEIFKSWPTETPPADALTQAGYALMVIDAYGFNERKSQAPLRDHRAGPKNEEALYKMFLWQGRTLWGMMLRDDALALNYLLSRPEIDPKRIAALGTSMGSLRSLWLAALDERVQAAVCIAGLSRCQDVLSTGRINRHSLYFFIPNLLKEQIDTEAVAALVCPRPLLTLTGSKDETSPLSGVEIINRFTQRIYQLYHAEDRFTGKIYPNIGHNCPPNMWNDALNWLKQNL